MDENFPLALFRQLRADGVDVEHIITIGWRGAPDARICERLATADVVFLTQDEDFLFDASGAATVVLSRVRQSRRLPSACRCGGAAENACASRNACRTAFELLDDGGLVPWVHADAATWTARPVER